jgi:hypothetical protein
MPRDRSIPAHEATLLHRFLGLLLIACMLGLGTPARSKAQDQGASVTELAPLTARFEEPLIATAPTTGMEDAALLQAIRIYEGQSAEDDFRPFEAFLATNPDSGWRVALLTNLGLSYYRYGFFSRAISAWEHAWQEGRAVCLDDVRSGLQGATLAEVARLADHAKFEYRLIQREPGQPVPIPSIVRWKVNHFSNLLRVEDPTFGADSAGWLANDNSGCMPAVVRLPVSCRHTVRRATARGVP